MPSGDTLLAWHALDTQLHVTATYSPGFGLRGGHPVIEFRKGYIELAFFEGILPRHYVGGGIVMRIIWMAKTAVAGNCVWINVFERHDISKDLDLDHFEGGAHAVVATSPNSGSPVLTDVTFAPGALPAGLQGGEHVRLHLARYGNDGLDTLPAGAAGDVQLLAVSLREL